MLLFGTNSASSISRHGLAGLACIAILLTGCPGAGQQTPAPLQNQIVFESNRILTQGAVHQDLYRMNADGSGVVQLTDSIEDEADPAVSPDGRLIAFTRGTVGEDIFVMDADGGHIRQVTTYGASDFRPAWAPDGSYLVYASEAVGRYELFTIKPDGTNRKQLTFRPYNNDWVSAGAFSPDGKRLVFESWDREQRIAELFIMNLADSALTGLPVGVPVARSAAWSPDGQRIAFVGAITRLTGHALYVSDLNGRHVHRLVDLHREATAPAWSPDSQKLVYENRGEAGEDRLFVIDAEGGQPQALTDADGATPHWSR